MPVINVLHRRWDFTTTVVVILPKVLVLGLVNANLVALFVNISVNLAFGVAAAAEEEAAEVEAAEEEAAEEEAAVESAEEAVEEVATKEQTAEEAERKRAEEEAKKNAELRATYRKYMNQVSFIFILCKFDS